MTVPGVGLTQDLFLPDRLQFSFVDPVIKLSEWPCAFIDALTA